MFDDSLLEDRAALTAADEHLRHLAGQGARIRIAAAEVLGPGGPGALVDGFEGGRAARGVIALGAEARLIRAVVEPICPSPFVAWPTTGLPGWVGPLDTVVVLASQGSDPGLMSSVAEAVRRGAALVLAADPASPIAEMARGSASLLVPVRTPDPLAAATVVLAVLNELGIGPRVRPEHVAESADMVAEQCSPHRDLSSNPAKDLALCVADDTPMIWGGTVLAARASRRIAEAFRRATGRAVLSADATELMPVLSAAVPADPFADPFEDKALMTRPVLVLLDDGSEDDEVRRGRSELSAAAERRDVRLTRIGVERSSSTDLESYVELLQRGLFGAAYLSLGLSQS